MKDELIESLKKDFNRLYVREFTTEWREERFVRGMELDIMSFENTEKLIETLLQDERKKTLEEVKEIVDDINKAIFTLEWFKEREDIEQRLSKLLKEGNEN